jgi:hypothetical protein
VGFGGMSGSGRGGSGRRRSGSVIARGNCITSGRNGGCHRGEKKEEQVEDYGNEVLRSI